MSKRQVWVIELKRAADPDWEPTDFVYLKQSIAEHAASEHERCAFFPGSRYRAVKYVPAEEKP